MTKKNAFGLSRDIGDVVARTIRQNSGFGCVICGAAICQYEHVDPEFAEAKEHDPSKMTLLCYQHHGLVTKGLMSKETVKEAMKDPYCKRKGSPNGPFDFGPGHPRIVFGGTRFTQVRIPIQVNGVNLIEIKPPETSGAPVRISGIFHNSQGNESLTILDNHWFGSQENWDIETEGPRITIREKKGNIHLILKSEPREALVIERLNMKFQDIVIEADATKLHYLLPNGKVGLFTDLTIANAPIAISINGPEVPEPIGYPAGFIHRYTYRI